MQIGDLFKYLFGNRTAIALVATNRRTLMIGFAFVISTGFAREYDNEDLIHEPWHVLVPLVASLITSGMLFVLVYGLRIKPESNRPDASTGYASFLGLYWMTAPLAWLYAIPYERMLAPADATAANLWTLAIVATWRVFLMTRVISILLNIGVLASFMIVMLFADALVLMTLSVAELPLINFMGGVSLNESELLIADVAALTTVLGILSLPIWLIGSLIVFAAVRSDWSWLSQREAAVHTISYGVKALAIASVVIGVCLLPFAQAEQMRRYKVERHLTRDEIAEAISLMSQFEQSDFPPHWDPPPRAAYGQRRPDIDAVARVIASTPVADWVRDIYAHKLEFATRARSGWGWGTWPEMREGIVKYEKYSKVIERRESLELLLQIGSHLTNPDREAIQSLIELADNPLPQNEDASKEADTP